MGSSFFGRPKIGGSSSSSSQAKKGKNKNGSNKPKQPQRGLGVAQLEKIILHSEFSCNSFNTYYHPSTFNHQLNATASDDQYGRTPTRYGDSQPQVAPRWNPSYGILETQHFVEPNITKHFLRKDPRDKSLGFGIQNFETSEANEVDLELRLSL